MAERERLDAFLAHAGLGSRKDVKRLIRTGRITLDGETCRVAKTIIEGRTVALDGFAVAAPPQVETVLMYKPVGYSCSHNPDEEPIIDVLIPEELRLLELQSAGRLDRETSGLLVLSTNGTVIHKLTHPKHKLPKRYRVEFSGDLPSDVVEIFFDGLVLADEPKPCRPAILTIEAEGRASVLLTEGRYHQVRRMFAAVGGHVTKLHRDRIGSLQIPGDMVEGDVRPITADEEATLLTPPPEA